MSSIGSSKGETRRLSVHGLFDNRDNENDKLRERATDKPYLRIACTSQIYVALKCPCWHRVIDVLFSTVHLYIEEFESELFGFSLFFFCHEILSTFLAFTFI